jgi:C4-dicarboxylate transporter, DctM subunit
VAAISITLLVGLFSLLAIGIWIGITLLLVGAGALYFFRDTPVAGLLSINVWNTLTSTDLVSLPLFILMGEILFRADLSGSLLRGIAPWVERLPGRLLHVNILACTMFAAVSGSSAATTATVGRITVAELDKLGYDRPLVLGSLAGAGTLGFLIPPSIIMIVYGVLAQVSILDLFAAGIVPGLLLALCYVIYLGAVAIVRPQVTPPLARYSSWRERIAALRLIWPILTLMLAVLGSMYTGIASPTEAAALGVLAAAAICASQRTLTWANLREALMSTVRTTSMLGLIVAAAGFLSTVLGYLGIPQAVASGVAELGLAPYQIIIALLAVYLVLGCFLDGVSMLVMTLPVTLPMITAAGFDRVWYGIFLVLAIEMAQVTPPVGFNLFVIEDLTGESIWRIATYTLPFFVIMVAFTLLTAAFPQIVTFLPALIGSQ